MKLLIDMNLSPQWVPFLADYAIEAIHWSAIGPANATDQVLMDYARDLGMIVLTHDLDFSAILAATNGRKPSVVQLRLGNLIPENAFAWLVAVLRQTAAELDAGALVTLDRKRPRIRILPLRQINE